MVFARPEHDVFAAYALTYAEFRYMPAWLLMVWASVLAGFRLRTGFASSTIANFIAVSVAVVMLASMAYGFYGQTKSVPFDDASKHYAIAEGLTNLGLHREDKVGAIGFDNDAHWAHLDALMIVAEIHTDSVCTFWNLPPSEKSDVLTSLRKPAPEQSSPMRITISRAPAATSLSTLRHARTQTLAGAGLAIRKTTFIFSRRTREASAGAKTE